MLCSLIYQRQWLSQICFTYSVPLGGDRPLEARPFSLIGLYIGIFKKDDDRECSIRRCCRELDGYSGGLTLYASLATPLLLNWYYSNELRPPFGRSQPPLPTVASLWVWGPWAKELADYIPIPSWLSSFDLSWMATMLPCLLPALSLCLSLVSFWLKSYLSLSS